MKFKTEKKIDAKIVIGKVVKLSSHPDADKLWVVKVNVGKEEPLTIVCGAFNLKVGQVVPVVLPGGQVISEEGEVFKVGKAKIRGVKSYGMMCSERELGVGQDHEGIWILPQKLGKNLGEPLVKHLEKIK